MTPIETIHATWNEGDPLDGFLKACRQVVMNDDDIQHLSVVAQLLGQQVMSTGEGQALKSKARRKVDNTVAEMQTWAPNLMCGLEALEKMLNLDRQQQPPRFFDDFENRKSFLHDPLVQMMWLHRLDYDVVVDDTVWTKRYAKSTIQSFDHMPARVPWLVAGWFGYYHEQTYEIVKRALGKGDSDYLKEAVKWWEFALSCERTGNPLQEKAMAGYQAKVNQYATFREKASGTATSTVTKASSGGCFTLAIGICVSLGVIIAAATLL